MANGHIRCFNFPALNKQWLLCFKWVGYLVIQLRLCLQCFKCVGYLVIKLRLCLPFFPVTYFIFCHVIPFSLPFIGWLIKMTSSLTAVFQILYCSLFPTIWKCKCHVMQGFFYQQYLLKWFIFPYELFYSAISTSYRGRFLSSDSYVWESCTK